jgi:hypothetical protein
MKEAKILTFIQRAVRTGQVKISLHAAEEALVEEITRSEIEEIILSAKVLEDYPDWWLGASCLVYGRTKRGR